MEKLDQERANLDSIDDKILQLANERLATARRIGEIKKTIGKAVSDPCRENAVIDRLKANNRGPMSDDDIGEIWKALFAMSKREQNR
ncbi:MAG: chorismate mutase [Victivallaceae bacterium]|nr:chorismate mutase [Victivallaceae bacterium]